jgi:hypothetical protein
MRNIIIKKKCLLFKHEKNNQTLSNDWPTYCHTGIYMHLEKLPLCMEGTYRRGWVPEVRLRLIMYISQYHLNYNTATVKKSL